MTWKRFCYVVRKYQPKIREADRSYLRIYWGSGGPWASYQREGGVVVEMAKRENARRKRLDLPGSY